MRTRTVLLVLACGSLLPVCCRKAAVLPQGPPRIHFAQRTHDLGEIPISPAGRNVVFSFVNRGLSSLHVNRLVSSCGCAGATIDKPVLGPSEQGRVTVRIVPQQSEDRSATVTVHSNDPALSQLVLRLSWRAVAPLEFDPLSVDFGTLLPGESAEHNLKILRHDARPSAAACKITRVECTPPAHISAALSEETLRVSLVAGTNSGPATGRLVVHLQDCWRETLIVPLRWRVEDVVEVTPTSLFLGSGVAGQAVSKKFLISARSEATLELESIAFKQPPGASEVTFKRLAPNRILAEVRWTLPESPGVHNKQLIVRCKKPEPRTVEVRVSAYVTEPRPGKTQNRRNAQVQQ